MKRVLLLGGTGAMGVYLVETLRELEYEVFVTSRHARVGAPGVTYLQGNAHDLGFVQTCARTVCPSAIVDFMIYTTESFRERVHALLSLSEHYLFLSSYRVYAETVPLRETSPRLLDVCQEADYLRTDEYALTKARQEDLLRQAGRHTHWTILRPGITFSKARFQLGTLEANTLCWRSLHGFPVALPREMLDCQTTLTWGRDVAKMIARLVLNPKAYGEAFTTASAEHHTWRDIAALYAETIGTCLREVSLEDYIRIMGGVYQIRFDRLFNRVIDNRKVLAATGLSQTDFTPLAEALPRELVAFRGNPTYAYGVADGNARQDRLLGGYKAFFSLHGRQRWDYLQTRWPWFGGSLVLRAGRKALRLMCGGAR